MALKKKAKTTKEAPAVEAGVVETTPSADDRLADAQAKVEEALAAGVTAGEPAPEPEPAVETTDVAVKEPAAAPAASVGKVELAFNDCENTLIAPFGAFPTLKFEQGGIGDGELSYGSWVEVEVMSWNSLYMLVPGTDEEDDKHLLKYSYDGKVADSDGSDIREALAAMKADGYDKAEIKQYCQVVGVLTNADNKAAVSTHIGNFVVVQLAPMSRLKFEGHKMSTGLKVARGLITAEQARFVRWDAKPESKGKNSWTSAIPSVA